MEEAENLSLKELEECSYRTLQQKAKSMGLPSNVKKILLIEMIYTKIYCSPQQLDLTVARIRKERQQASMHKKSITKRNKKDTETAMVPTVSLLRTPSNTTEMVHCPNNVSGVFNPITNRSNRVLRSYHNKLDKYKNYKSFKVHDSVEEMLGNFSKGTQRERQVYEWNTAVKTLNTGMQGKRDPLMNGLMSQQQASRDAPMPVTKITLSGWKPPRHPIHTLHQPVEFGTARIRGSDGVTYTVATAINKSTQTSEREPNVLKKPPPLEYTNGDSNGAQGNAQALKTYLAMRRRSDANRKQVAVKSYRPLMPGHRSTDNVPRMDPKMARLHEARLNYETRDDLPARNYERPRVSNIDGANRSRLAQTLLAACNKRAVLRAGREHGSNARREPVRLNSAEEQMQRRVALRAECEDRENRAGPSRQDPAYGLKQYPGRSNRIDRNRRESTERGQSAYTRRPTFETPYAPQRRKITNTENLMCLDQPGTSRDYPNISTSHYAGNNTRAVAEPHRPYYQSKAGADPLRARRESAYMDCDTAGRSLPHMSEEFPPAYLHYQDHNDLSQPLFVDVGDNSGADGVYSRASQGVDHYSGTPDSLLATVDPRTPPPFYSLYDTDLYRDIDPYYMELEADRLLQETPSHMSSAFYRCPEMYESAATASALDFDDALDYISQDGEYMERIGMDRRMKCFMCTWAGAKHLLEYHIRMDHPGEIVQQNSQWIHAITLGCIKRGVKFLNECSGVVYLVNVYYKNGFVRAYIKTIPNNNGIDEMTIYGKLKMYSQNSGKSFKWMGLINVIPLAEDQTGRNERDAVKTEASNTTPTKSNILNNQLDSECQNSNKSDANLKNAAKVDQESVSAQNKTNNKTDLNKVQSNNATDVNGDRVTQSVSAVDKTNHTKLSMPILQTESNGNNEANQSNIDITATDSDHTSHFESDREKEAQNAISDCQTETDSAKVDQTVKDTVTAGQIALDNDKVDKNASRENNKEHAASDIGRNLNSDESKRNTNRFSETAGPSQSSAQTGLNRDHNMDQSGRNKRDSEPERETKRNVSVKFVLGEVEDGLDVDIRELKLTPAGTRLKLVDGEWKLEGDTGAACQTDLDEIEFFLIVTIFC